MDEADYVADLCALAAELARIAALPPVEQVLALGPLADRTPRSAAMRINNARREAARAAKRALGDGWGAQFELARQLGLSEAMVSRLLSGARRTQSRH